MEALEKLKAREEQKLSPKVLEPVRINSLEDIRRILQEFDPVFSKPGRPIQVNASLDDGQHKYAATTVTQSKSKREHILEGMEVIRRRIEVNEQVGEPVIINGREVQPAKLGNGVNGRTWVDPIIKQWMGGYRDGLLICWDINGQRYTYNIFEHKLRKANATDV